MNALGTLQSYENKGYRTFITLSTSQKIKSPENFNHFIYVTQVFNNSSLENISPRDLKILSLNLDVTAHHYKTMKLRKFVSKFVFIMSVPF